MHQTTLIPDSSFYICLLDDIDCPNELIKIIKSKLFQTIIGKIVKSEISKSKKYQKISKEIESEILDFSYYHYGEIIRPLLSIKEIEKGEHEVIVISYIHYSLGLSYITILDDKSPRNLLLTNYQDMSEFLMGTVRFLEYCTLECELFSISICIALMKKIKKSRFRVSDEIITTTITRLEEESHGKYPN